MMWEITLSLPIDCRPAPRPRITKSAAFNPQWYTDLKLAINHRARAEMKKAGYLPLRAPVRLEITVAREHDVTKQLFGDVDNLLKTVMDALKGVCYDDDRFVTSASISKIKAPSPKLSIRVFT